MQAYLFCYETMTGMASPVQGILTLFDPLLSVVPRWPFQVGVAFKMDRESFNPHSEAADKYPAQNRPHLRH